MKRSPQVQSNSAADLVRPMKNKLSVLSAILALFLAGCSSKPEDTAKKNHQELDGFPQWTQVALVLREPLELFGYAAIFWVFIGGPIASFSKRVGKSGD